MSDLWTGDEYAFRFETQNNKPVIKIHRVTSSYPTGRKSKHVSMEARATEIRELPLNRQEAEELVQEYLYDLHPKTQMIVVEKLCAG